MRTWAATVDHDATDNGVLARLSGEFVSEAPSQLPHPVGGGARNRDGHRRTGPRPRPRSARSEAQSALARSSVLVCRAGSGERRAKDESAAPTLKGRPSGLNSGKVAYSMWVNSLEFDDTWSMHSRSNSAPVCTCARRNECGAMCQACLMRSDRRGSWIVRAMNRSM